MQLRRKDDNSGKTDRQYVAWRTVKDIGISNNILLNILTEEKPGTPIKDYYNGFCVRYKI